MTHAQREAARKRWREMYQNYMKAQALLWEVLMHPDATAENIMPARQSFINISKHVRGVQDSLEKLNVLGFHDPRLPRA
jgi:hypothetical protein